MSEDIDPDFIAIGIEGIGRQTGLNKAGNLQTKGWLIGTSGIRPYISDLTFEEWDAKTGLLLDSLQSTDDKLDFFQGNLRFSGYQFELENTDQLAERLLFRQTRAPATLQERISASASSFKIDVSGKEGSTAYIGDETFRIGANTSSSGGVYTYDIFDRGLYQSQASAHRADANVFFQQPYWKTRTVKLFAVEVTGAGDTTFTIRQKGLYTLRGEVVADRGKLILQCDGATSELNGTTGGRRERKFESLGGSQAQPSFLFSGYEPVGVFSVPYTSQIVKGDVGEPSSGTDRQFAFQVGDEDDGVVFGAAGEFTTGTPTVMDAITMTGTGNASDGAPLLGQAIDKETIKGDQGEIPSLPIVHITKDCWEVFAIDRDRGVSPVHAVADAIDEKFRWHCLTVYAAINLSTPSDTATPSEFDVLRPDWSTNAKRLYESDIVATIKRLVRRYDTRDFQVDREVIGASGSTVELRKWSKDRFLNAYGFNEGITDSGEMTVFKKRTPDVADLDDAKNAAITAQPSETLSWQTGRASTADVIKATIGNTDMTDGRTIFIRAIDDAETRPGDVQGEADIEIDLGTKDPPDTLGDDGHTSFSDARRRLVSQALLQHFEIPSVTILAEDQSITGNGYDMGAPVTLDDLDITPGWLVDDGSRITATTDERFTGYIIGRRLFLSDPNRSSGYELTILFAGRNVTRWRAPSGVIQSVTTDGSDHVLTLGGDGSGTEANSAFGQTNPAGWRLHDDQTSASTADEQQEDADFFRPDDEVEIYNPDGTYWTNNAVKTVKSVSEPNNTIRVEGTWSTDPPVGRIVNLAFVDTDFSGSGYQNIGLDGTFDNISTVYFALADGDDTLGDSGADAETYGV